MKILLIINLVALDLFIAFLVFKQTEKSQITNVKTPEIDTSIIDDLTKRVGNLELTPYPSPAPAGTSGQVKTVAVVAPTKKLSKSISYVNIPGSSETNLTSWMDMAGTDFYFDKAEYSGFQNMTLEANIRLFNGSGIGSIRLLDVTHGIAVVGSEINTTSQSEVILDSGLLTIWNGRNLYRIQAKSNSSDRLIYSWGKLKIVTQN